ncbi:MAG: uncharacterized protein A8A55_3241, partial [Amphiamblys sp. WSBS2006]
KLELSLFAINILPKLALHEENEMKEFILSAEKKEYVSKVIRAENSSIWLGKVKKMELFRYAINVLPKLQLHEENVMDEFCLSADRIEYVSEAILAENNIWLGKVNKLDLKLFAINILPKLKLHEENVMEEFSLSVEKEEYVSEVIRAKNNSIWFGRLKNLRLKSFAIRILPKLKLHEENEMEEFSLNSEKKEYVSEVIRAENNTIWLGSVKKVTLFRYAINILSKLHEKNVMEELCLSVDRIEHVSEVIRAENNSIKLGKVNKLDLKLLMINILPKLQLHEENEMEEFLLSADREEYVSEVILAKNNTIWLGKVKKLELKLFAINILPKLKLHEENEMEEICLSLIIPKLEHAYKIILAKKHRISTRGVKNLVLSGYAINFLPEIHGASDL